ncbi:hydroxyacid dehydrogenase [Geosporobacter ferrireducens]|uniref:Phosphoglycerate dehydrogenase n=1 Tax=Geosporobacter ferrireducens TaxID=1424294 RepID=A0A1D8GMC2_9FIRM|nr:hydroxyacid dehydrogenase [Geosporobacter ferrireducens]AOT72078.1 phosphoglycerate dehydrogenase [Geosporobacter ferrireducens]MTI55962.1 hydroxyacid dehydrogenase [Geosporobacter ferrireducens]
MATVLLSHELYKDGMEILKKGIDIIIANNSNMRAIIEDLKKADGLILRVGRIDREIMEECPNLKVISRPGVGVDTVDVDAATALGIPVVIAPGANLRSVAEHAIALMYTITKNVVESHEETKNGNFPIRNKYMAIELAEHKMGIIGFGNIGKETAKLCSMNGMEVYIYDPFVKKETAEALGYTYIQNLHDILAICDVISLHMPSTPETKKMFGNKEFHAMKEGIFIVNCARGDIVDEDALYEALANGKVAGAAVDVMEAEPMDPNNKLFTLKNFIATPHMAALTKESASRTSQLTVEGTLAVIRGEKWPHVANKEVYDHPRWNK